MNELERLKDNALKLAQHHKDNCDDPHCGISLTLIGVLLSKAGIEISKEEHSVLV